MIIVEILYLCDTKTSNLGFLMRLKPLFLAVALLIVTYGFAQTSSERTPFKNGKMAVWLNTSMGLNVIDCSDQGASPLQYIGVGANLRGGVTLEWKRCHVQATTTGLVSLISNNSNQSYAFGIDSRAEFLYRTNVFRSNNWQLWAGATLQNYFVLHEPARYRHGKIQLRTHLRWGPFFAQSIRKTFTALGWHRESSRVRLHGQLHF